MNNKKLEQIGNWLISKHLILEYLYGTNDLESEWVDLCLYISKNEILKITFDKITGGIMTIAKEDILDLTE